MTGIRGRLFLGFCMLTIPFILMTVIFLFKINSVQTFAQSLVSTVIPTQELVAGLDGRILESEVAVYEWLVMHDEESKNQFSEAWDAIRGARGRMLTLAPQWSNKKFIERYMTIQNIYDSLFAIQSKVMLQQLNSLEATRDMIKNEKIPITDKLLTLINGTRSPSGLRQGGLFDIQESELMQGAESILANIKTLKIMVYTILTITIVLSIIVFFFTVNKILQPIRLFRSHSNKVAAGDLTQRMTINSMDEIGNLGTDLNTMTESLASISKKITEASGKMFSALEEVKRAADMQAVGVSEQASSINEITASLEEIDKSAAQTMQKAKILGEISEETSQKGQKGLDAVEQSIEGMKLIRNKVQTIAKTILELSNQTQQVGEITAVVNTIALQSKMLALNASIEASKAGEAGKGFAVVAAEVKDLAEQSAQSTTQVQKILEDIRHGTEKAVIVTEEGTKGVDEGTNIVEQMGEIVHSLTDAINETMIASQQIEAAVRQESLGIEQITSGMNEINQVTASFVNTVKQTTDSIQQLSEIAKNIKDYVNAYKV